MATPGKAALARLTRQPKVIPNVHLDLAEYQAAVDSGATLVSEEKVALTQDLAAWYIDLPEFEAERTIINEHVQFLHDEMVKGSFNPHLVILAVCDLGGVTYKINGQHTCWAKFLLPSYTPTVRQMRFRAASEEQMRRLYGQFDRNKSRSEAHITRVHLAGVDGLKEIPRDVVDRLNQGLRLWLFEDRRENQRFKAEDLARAVVARYLPLYQKVGALYADIGTTNFKILKRAPTMAAILATVDKAPLVAREFWGGVATGADLGAKDARLHLRNYLMSTGLSTKGTDQSKEVVGQEDMFRRCLVAWNKWREGEPVQILRGTAERPKVK